VKACQVSDSMSIVKCHISGVRYQVSSDNMSSISVRYQVSEIRCQVQHVMYRCQISTVRDQVSSIIYQCQIINMSVSGELNIEL